MKKERRPYQQVLTLLTSIVFICVVVPIIIFVQLILLIFT